MDILTAVNQTIAKGFPWLVFPRSLELEFKKVVRKRILNRVVTVGLSAIIFIIVFCIFDWVFLQSHIAAHTSVIRLVFVIPIIIITTLWLCFKPPKYYLLIYSSTHLLTSLSIIYIIWYTHIRGINLPYEGLMVTMMYGFFIMALPFYTALLLNITVVIIYALTEPLYYFSFPDYLNNILFLSIILISAAIGAYVNEYNQRGNFLRKRALDIHHENTLASINKKNIYLAAASHDIRQPLQGISLISQSLMSDLPDNDKISRLNSGIESLNSMFIQMLDMSKINFNLVKPIHERINLKELVTQLTDGVSERLNNKGIRLEINVDEVNVISDFTILSRVINNLIENSIRHSGCDVISIKSEIIANDIKLSIMDNGKGISKEVQNSMFSEFTKGNDAIEGLGLGLSIVYNFCKKLEHELSFESTKNSTIFSIALPLDNRELKSEQTTGNNQKTILIIDDDQEIINIISVILKAWNYTVISANGVQHGISLINEDLNCVICDWNLNDGCGETIIQECHEKCIPSILISSQKITSLDILNKCKFIQKPISPSKLKSSLLKII
jgi:signal transduction histidine kinase/CheY-like chemotaxis protein